MPRIIVWEVCKETLDILAMYLRDEPMPSELTPTMQLYRRAQESTLKEKTVQWEEQDRLNVEARKHARNEARKPRSTDE